MKTLLLLGMLKQDPLLLKDKELPSFGEYFVLARERCLEDFFAYDLRKKNVIEEHETISGVQQYSYELWRKDSSSLFLFGNIPETYDTFAPYPVMGIALKLEF